MLSISVVQFVPITIYTTTTTTTTTTKFYY